MVIGQVGLTCEDGCRKIEYLGVGQIEQLREAWPERANEYRRQRVEPTKAQLRRLRRTDPALPLATELPAASSGTGN
jgi:hypothetical protein